MSQRRRQPEKWEKIMGYGITILFTGFMFAGSWYILLSGESYKDLREWATGGIGGVLGFWFNEFKRITG